MERIDKIFAALDCCQDTETPACETCPYADPDIGTCDTLTPLYEDIRAEILDWRPRVMTLTEALAADYVYLEIKLHSSLPCDCCILAIDPDGGILPLHKGFCAYLDGEDYGIDWRCWTSRPTDEQREATPWNP